MAEIAIMAGIAIAQAVVSYVLRPKFHHEVQGPRLADLVVQVSTYGEAIPIAYGTNRMSGNVIWSTGIKETVHTTESHSKSGTTIETSYSYSCSFAVAFAEGPCKQLLRVWADGKLLLDLTRPPEPEEEPIDDLETEPEPIYPGAQRQPKNLYTHKNGDTTQVLQPVSYQFYRGTEDQMPDTTMQAAVGAGACPAYRGLVYIVFNELQLANFANHIPAITAEIAFNSQDLFPKVGPIVSEPLLDDSFLYLDPYRPYLFWANDGKVYRVNTETNSLELVIGDEAHDPIVTDSEGYAYVPIGSGDCNVIKKFDVITMTEQGHAGISGSVTGRPDTIWNTDRMLVFDTAKGKYLAVMGHEEVTLINRVNMSIVGRNYCGDSPSGTSSVDIGMAYGGGYLWVASHTADANTFEIYRLNPDALGDFNFRPVAFKTYGMPSSIPVKSLVYCATDNTLIFASTQGFWKYDIATDALTWNDLAVGQPPRTIGGIGSNDSFATSGIRGGYIWDSYSKINPVTLQVVKNYDPSDFSLTGAGSLGSVITQVYEPATNSVFTYTSNGLYRFYLDVSESTNVTLDKVVGDIFTRCQLKSSEQNVSSLIPFWVRGYIIGKQSEARAVLENICTAYQFDIVERDYAAVAVRRGGTTAAVIPEDDLIPPEGNDNSEPVRVIETQAQDVDLPRKVDVTYIDCDRDYQEGNQASKRISAPVSTMGSQDSQNVTMPMVMRPTEAKMLAEILLYEQWASRMSYETKLLPKWMLLDPTDVVEIALPDFTIRCRLDRLDIGYDITAHGLQSDDGVYVSFVKGSSGESGDSGTIGTGGGGGTGGGSTSFPITDVALMDTPFLRDIDAQSFTASGFYFSFLPEATANWKSAALLRSEDSSTFLQFGSGNAYAPWGRIVGVVPAPVSPHQFDRTTTIRVQMVVGLLSSVTELDVLNGYNAAWLSNGEIIQFANATAVDMSGAYDLTVLLRGRRGTEHLVSTHATGEKFVLLTDAAFKAKAAISEIGLDRWYRALTTNLAISDVNSPKHKMTLAGNDLKPWSPQHVKVVKQDNNDLVISWVRRTRLGGGWLNGNGTVPLSEISERYEVDIVSSNGSSENVWPPQLATSVLRHRYVDGASGNDTADGSSAAPWKTLSYAASQLQAGDCIHVLPGDYAEVTISTNGTSTARIAFLSEQKWGAKISHNGAGRDNAVRIIGSYVDFIGFDVTGGASADATFNGIKLDGSGGVGSKYVRILDNKVHDILVPPGIGAVGINDSYYYLDTDNQAKSRFNEISRNFIYSIHEASGETLKGVGIYLSTYRATVQNNLILNAHEYGVHLWHSASAATITNNTIVHIGITGSDGRGIEIGAGDAPGGVTCDSCVVNNNLIAHCSLYGIQEFGTTGTHNTYKNNLFYDNASSNLFQNGNTATASVVANPLFVNDTGDESGDYRIAQGSAAIDAGTSESAPSTDIERKSRAAIDIGAYEYGTSNAAGVRTLASSTTSVTYTASQQIADFGTTVSTIDVSVYQIGSAGRGFPSGNVLTPVAPPIDTGGEVEPPPPSGGGTTTPPGTIQPRFFGMHKLVKTHAWPNESTRAIRLMNTGTSWKDTEPTQGNPSFTVLDSWLDEAQSHSADVIYVFYKVPGWANDGAAEAVLPSDATFAAGFAEELAIHSAARKAAGKTGIDYYELWNEPNISVYANGGWNTTNMQRIAAMCIAMAAEIRAHDPSAKILSPSPTAVVGYMADKVLGDLWDEIVLQGGSITAVHDIVAFHGYGDYQAESWVSRFNNVKSAMNTHHVVQEVWDTEAAWGQNLGGNTQAWGADFLTKWYVLKASLGLGRFYWYAWDNNPVPDNEWGMLWNSSTGVETSAGKAFGIVQNWLIGTVVANPAAQSNGIWSATFQKTDGKSVKVMWRTSGSGNVSVESKYASYQDVTGATHSISGSVTLATSPIALMET